MDDANDDDSVSCDNVDVLDGAGVVVVVVLVVVVVDWVVDVVLARVELIVDEAAVLMTFLILLNMVVDSRS